MLVFHHPAIFAQVTGFVKILNHFNSDVLNGENNEI